MSSGLAITDSDSIAPTRIRSGHHGGGDQVATELREHDAVARARRPGARPGRSAAGRWPRTAGPPPGPRDRRRPCRSRAPATTSRRPRAAGRSSARPRSATAARATPTRGAPWRARPARRAAAPDCAITWAAGPDRSASSRSSTAPCRSAWISLSRAVSRSASRRELANTMVDRCAVTRSTTRSSTCGQMLVRPDLAGRLAGEVAGHGAQLAHVRHRNDDVHVDLLGRWRLHDGDGPAAGEEPRDLRHGPHRRGQADPLRRAVEQGIQPVERNRQVCTPFGAGDGVHLVDDDRPDAGQHLPGAAGQQQEQRLGRGDQDVRPVPGERPAVARRGVARPDRHADARASGCRACAATEPIPVSGDRRLRSTSTASALSGDR